MIDNTRSDHLSLILNSQADVTRERAAFFHRIYETFYSTRERDSAQALAERWAMVLPALPAKTAWRLLPHRGWLTIEEEPGRPYVISVWQAGRWLRIGVKLDPRLIHFSADVQPAISELFYGNSCHFTARGDGYFFDWSFDVPDLYRSMIEQETWIMAVMHLYEMVGILLAQHSDPMAGNSA